MPPTSTTSGTPEDARRAEELRARVLAATASAPSPTRAVGRLRTVLVLGLAAGLAVGVFWIAGGLSHSAGRPLAITGSIAAGAAVTALLSAWIAWWRGTSMVGRPLVALAAVVAFAPTAIFAWLVSWHGRYTEPFARVGWRCLGLTLATGALLVVAALVLRRRTVAIYPGWRGAALGTVAGALGGMLVDLWCPLTNAPHVLVGHVLPVVLLAAVSALVGQAVLPVRAR